MKPRTLFLRVQALKLNVIWAHMGAETGTLGPNYLITILVVGPLGQSPQNLAVPCQALPATLWSHGLPCQHTRGITGSFGFGGYKVCVGWTAQPVILPVKDITEYVHIQVLLYFYYSTITGCGVLLKFALEGYDAISFE